MSARDSSAWRYAIALAATAAACLPVTAHAAETDYAEKAEHAIARACAGMAGNPITADRLARAMLIETTAGVDIAPVDNPARSIADPNLLTDRSSDERNELRELRSIMLERLARPKTTIGKALIVSPQPGNILSGGDWLFASSSPYTLTCAKAPEPREAVFTRIGPIVLRKGVDDLAKIGDERKSAGSAQITFDDFRTTNLAGEEKKTVKLLINAAAGYVFGRGNEDRYAMAYGEYSRSRVRVRTAPVATAPEKNGSADDIDALELGLLGRARIGEAARATGRLGIILDEVTKARYLNGNIAFEPITGGTLGLGICNLGSFKKIGLGIVARCGIHAEGDIRQALRKGSADISKADQLLALGGSVRFEFQRGLDEDDNPQDGLTGSVVYRYLNMVSGRGPDIDRVDATLAYRWWVGDLGFDFGFTYSDGIERKSLADEHRFGFTFGVMY